LFYLFASAKRFSIRSRSSRSLRRVEDWKTQYQRECNILSLESIRHEVLFKVGQRRIYHTVLRGEVGGRIHCSMLSLGAHFFRKSGLLS
jgi:hypothetical protein